MQGRTHGIRTIIKSFDGADSDAVEAYNAERRVYKRLRALQGKHIPRLLFWGPLQETTNPTLVLERCGTPLVRAKLTDQQRVAAEEALSALHSKGFAHGNLSLRNLLWDAAKMRVVLIDLAEAYRPSRSSTCMSDEKNELKALLE